MPGQSKDMLQAHTSSSLQYVHYPAGGYLDGVPHQVKKVVGFTAGTRPNQSLLLVEPHRGTSMRNTELQQAQAEDAALMLLLHEVLNRLTCAAFIYCNGCSE